MFQNSEGNINLGVLFNDPDVDLDDIYWYNALAMKMSVSIHEKEGLVILDLECDTYSCYVELHSEG